MTAGGFPQFSLTTVNQSLCSRRIIFKARAETSFLGFDQIELCAVG